MRQILDMLVWLAFIAVVGAIVYLAPRFADSVAAIGSRHGEQCRTCHEIASFAPDSDDTNP
jgi:hypothetical protein